MKIGILADVHGNLPGLKACLDLLESEEADQIVCLGDLVQYGPFPSEVVDIFMERGIDVIQGNCDRAAARGRSSTGDSFQNIHWQNQAEELFTWTRNNLSSSQKRYLKNLPQELRFQAGTVRILFVHGVPGDIRGSVRQNSSMDVYNFLLQRNGCDILVTGHTHRMFLQPLHRGMILNPGSVGGGTLPGESTLAILNINDDTTVTSVAWFRVPYDTESYSKKYLGAHLPETFLKCILLGRDPRGEWLTDDITRRQQWARPL